MCGRYATSQTTSTINRAFEADLLALDPELAGKNTNLSGETLAEGTPPTELDADYNVAPTKPAPLIIGRSAPDSDASVRELTIARWGLIPSWAKDAKIGNRLINARYETLTEKPSFRSAFAKRRALVPADGYYEWYTPAAPAEGSHDRKSAGRTKAAKQPYFIRPKDGSPLAMAGLYEFWKNPQTDSWVLSFTIITTSAEDDLGHIHDRMPLMVGPDHFDAWLHADTTDGDPRELLVPAAPGLLEAYPVSRAVNNVRNNGPELIDPLPLS